MACDAGRRGAGAQRQPDIGNLKATRPPAQNDVVKAINGDPFIGMFETPVTSSPLVRAQAAGAGETRKMRKPPSAPALTQPTALPCAQVANFLSNLPAYRTGVSPLLRGVEIGLTHGFFVAGPFIKLGPLRATEAAEVSGSLSAAGLVLILTACLSSARPATARAPFSRSPT